MIFRPFHYFDAGCAAYVPGCGTLGKCAVVDPQARDLEAYLEFAAGKGMRITHVIDTHVHADHRWGGLEVARRAEEFVEALSNVPAKPTEMRRILHENRSGHPA